MNKIFKTLLISSLINIILIVSKIIFGVIGNSMALIADALHSLSDLVTDVVGIAGNKISNRPADKEHPYGHGKMEYVTSILIGTVIFFLGISLLIDSIYKKNYIPTNIVLVGILLTMIAKYILSFYIIKKGKECKNNILIASGTESKMDVLSSFVVLLSFIGSKLIKYNDLFRYSDKIGSIIVSIFIIFVALSIFKNNINSLLDERENDKRFLNRINRLIRKSKQVKRVDSIDILKSGHYYKAIIEISVDGNLSLIESHNIAHRVEQYILYKEEKIRYITIHVNPYIKR